MEGWGLIESSVQRVSLIQHIDVERFAYFEFHAKIFV
jgi:hypothetical protein